MDHRQVPFRPEASRPGGYANSGEDPYAAYNGVGYGDPGYSNPGYNGPASQDAGVPGTRTVRGFVDPGYQGSGPRALPPGSDYSAPDYPQAGLTAPQDFGGTAFGGGGYGDPAGYSQPWDYSQPLRYDDEPGHSGSGYPGPGHPSGPYPVQGGYDSAAYNGSELSRPGIDGLGYDLSGIIGTSDFPAFGYDEPSVERLSYDDPRYTDGPGYGQPRYGEPQGYDQQGWDPQAYGRDGQGGSRQDRPAFDDTRLDAFFGPDQRDPRDGGDPGPRRPSPDAFTPASPSPRTRRSAETRMDLGFRALGMNQTRMDMQALRDEPRFDETRLDNMRAVGTGPMQARSATGLLARPAEHPMSWPDDTSLDSFAGLDFDDMPEVRPEPRSRAVAAALREAPPLQEDTGSQRVVGRRRGRNSDRRQWLALGAVAVVAVGAIAGVLSKFAFSGPSGPAHTISTPNQLDSYTRNPNLEKAMKVSQLRDDVMQSSAGQASNVVSALYSMGNAAPGQGGLQAFMFVGGNLANSDPATSLASFEQTYPHAQVVPTGALGGKAACTQAVSQGEQVSMCVYFDNDSFGTFMSPSMNINQLEHVMQTARPGVEHVK